MNDKLFNKLWLDALEQPNKELFIAEYGYPDWFHPNPEESETEKINYISFNLEEAIKILEEIHTAAHMTIKEILEICTIQKFKKFFSYRKKNAMLLYLSFFHAYNYY